MNYNTLFAARLRKKESGRRSDLSLTRALSWIQLTVDNNTQGSKPQGIKTDYGLRGRSGTKSSSLPASFRFSNPKVLRRRYFVLLILALTALFFAGCGPEVITIDTRTDYVDSHDLIDAPDVYIASVKDKREDGAAALGRITGQVSHKKEEIYLADSLSTLVKNYFNDLIVNHSPTRPVEVVINSFSLVENYSQKNEYHLIGSLIYKYIDGKGESTSFVSNISKDFNRDQNDIASGINQALRESLFGFIDKLNANDGNIPEPHDLVPLDDSTVSRENTAINDDRIVTEPDSLAEPWVRPAQVSPYLGGDPGRSVNHAVRPGYTSRSDSTVRSQIIYDEPVEVVQIETVHKHLGAGMAYYTGDRITGGMQIEFRMSWQKPDWEYGFSVGFFYVNFINIPYEGNLWAINLPWNMKYMLSHSYISPYISGTVKFIAGQNNESGTGSPPYYNNSDNVSSTFWGPTFEESFGLAFNRSIFIEAGVYEMFLFNSNIFSNDVGFRLGLHFTVTK